MPDYKVSLYRPIEVEIDGQGFRLKKLNRVMFTSLGEFGKKEAAAEGSFAKVEVMYDQLQAFVDAPAEVIDDLTAEQVHELFQIINQVVFVGAKDTGTSKEETELKNAPKPGDVPAV